jgi:2-polyprenyl-3-methyl-5-hydroxy-6-metoxy-1,4-benzoquinol methylase
MAVSPVCVCGSECWTPVFVYDAPPSGEIRFQFSATDGYHREVWRCGVCGHFISVHEMDDRELYMGEYVNATYNDNEGLRRNFDRITSLDPAKSDNVGRVRRVIEFAASNFGSSFRPSVLDVGSGLCVFLHRLKTAGWDCTALDPDLRAAKHAQDYVGVKGVCADFIQAEGLGCFDVVTFNKVLEHVRDPIAMLHKTKDYIKPSGFIYVELPDGEAAKDEGAGREEFFIDHHHIFSMASMTMLAYRAGFRVKIAERLREPSTKYTLCMFLIKQTC